MTTESSTLVKALENVISREEGLELVWNSDAPSDDQAVAMLERSAQLAASGDPDGAEEWQAWAHETRSLITHRIIFATSPATSDEASRILASMRERFDDAFLEFCTRSADSALAKLEQAIERVKAGDLPATAATEFVGNASSRAGFLKIIAHMTEQPAHQAQADFVNGNFLLMRGQLEEAAGQSAEAAATRAQSKQALEACAQNGSAPAALRAKAEGNLAALAGPEHLEEVYEHQAAAQRLAEEAGDRDGLRVVRRDRAYWARQRQDWAAACELYQQNIADMERALWKEHSPIFQSELVRQAVPDFEAIVDVCLERAKSDPSWYERALEYAEQGKARAFLRTLADIGSAPTNVPPRLLKRDAEIMRRMQALGSALVGFSTAGLGEKYKPQAEALQNALAVNEDQIEKFSRARAMDLQCVPCTFAEMVKLVPADGAIVSYFSLEERTLAFVLDSQGLACRPVEIPLSRLDLARAVVNIKAQIQMRADFAGWNEVQKRLDMQIEYIWPQHNLHYLYGHLVEPIAPQLRGKRCLYIVPHGPLRDLPFQALLLPDETSLVDHFAIAYASGVAVLRQNRARGRSSLSTCFAAGVAPDKGGPASSQAEADAVAGIFGATAQPAMRAVVLAQAGSFDIIHLACHSNLNNALTTFQGLALEDGVLTQHEIAGMRCQSTLVTLSACTAAEGDVLPGAEMSGLVGAFFRAGSPSVLASLWPVEDKVAMPMMNALYTALKDPGVSKAEALQRAQCAIKSEPRFNHPYFWAQFCLWGDT